MEYAIPGFIQRFCSPNAVLTLCEYLEDYASPETKAAGYQQIERELAKITNHGEKIKLIERLEKIKNGQRDL